MILRWFDAQFAISVPPSTTRAQHFSVDALKREFQNMVSDPNTGQAPMTLEALRKRCSTLTEYWRGKRIQKIVQYVTYFAALTENPKARFLVPNYAS